MRLRHTPARTILVAAAMVGLLAIASLATHGDGSATAPPGSGIANSIGQHLVVVGALVLAPIVLVGGGALFIYAQIFRRTADPMLQEKLRKSRRAGLVLLAIAVGLMIYHLRTGRNPLSFLHLQNPLRRLVNVGHGKLPNGDVHRGTHGGISNTDWTLTALIWIALVAAIGLLLWRWRLVHERRELRLPKPAAEEPGPDLDGLRRERNPRRAVIAAYAVMEGLMGRDGLARDVHEAPMEYLGRVTRHGHTRVVSVHRLTGLFQRARFSHRPVDENMREQAIAAVEELADDSGDAGEPA
jgi:uncharacterized protein YjeT (DUF2065 family)